MSCILNPFQLKELQHEAGSLLNQSGFHWNVDGGCTINPEDDTVWEAYAKVISLTERLWTISDRDSRATDMQTNFASTGGRIFKLFMQLCLLQPGVERPFTVQSHPIRTV